MRRFLQKDNVLVFSNSIKVSKYQPSFNNSFQQFARAMQIDFLSMH